MAAAPALNDAPFPATIAGVRVRRLGERACIVSVGADLRRVATGALEDAVATAGGFGCEDFVFDLTALRAYEAGGLRRLPAQDAWTLAPSLAEALRVLLACPVEPRSAPVEPLGADE